MGDIPQAQKVLSRKLKTKEHLAQLGLSRKKLNGSRKLWRIFITLKDA
jgi:hypothetical protein